MSPSNNTGSRSGVNSGGIGKFLAITAVAGAVAWACIASIGSVVQHPVAVVMLYAIAFLAYFLAVRHVIGQEQVGRSLTLILIVGLLYRALAFGGSPSDDMWCVVQGPFRAVRWSVLKSLGMRDQGYGWTVEMQVRAARARLQIQEVPVSYRKRIGRSKISGTLHGTMLAGITIIGTILRYAAQPRLRSLPGMVTPALCPDTRRGPDRQVSSSD